MRVGDASLQYSGIREPEDSQPSGAVDGGLSVHITNDTWNPATVEITKTTNNVSDRVFPVLHCMIVWSMSLFILSVRWNKAVSKEYSTLETVLGHKGLPSFRNGMMADGCVSVDITICRGNPATGEI